MKMINFYRFNITINYVEGKRIKRIRYIYKIRYWERETGADIYPKPWNAEYYYYRFINNENSVNLNDETKIANVNDTTSCQEDMHILQINKFIWLHLYYYDSLLR